MVKLYQLKNSDEAITMIKGKKGTEVELIYKERRADTRR